tara:strand:- start:1051 stop:1383 length:333 start_codon:yes stop_codon:yes gene_type:complete
MQFTLDSQEHVKQCLAQEFPGYNIASKPVIFAGEDLNKLKKENKQFFFGVLTVSDNVQADLTYNDKTILTVDSGSQIIILFTDAHFKDLQEADTTPEGLFRGFQINVQIP